ncbi:MAG: peptidoglycan editing factor PgeF [Gammaproteobacteria bacterium]|nr:peptidoglycan editing factor PgeF [Gammaproteobacteria bacterium]
MRSAPLITPSWPAPHWVKAVTTTRQGGVSAGAFASFNLAQHVGDTANNVSLNRVQLASLLNLPQSPHWLTQVHGNRVIELSDTDEQGMVPKADASYTRAAGQVCAVMTADCLPILLCHRRHKIIAAVHVGWRGLAQGVIEAALTHFDGHSNPRSSHKNQMLAWLGPAISSKAFEVGVEVYRTLALDQDSAACFTTSSDAHWHADLYELARLRLRKAGVAAIYGGEFCSYTDSARFFSYRRDGKSTGRMASLIWMDDKGC